MRYKAFFRSYGDEGVLVNTEYQRLKSFTFIKRVDIAIKSRKKVHFISIGNVTLTTFKLHPSIFYSFRFPLIIVIYIVDYCYIRDKLPVYTCDINYPSFEIR